VSRIAQPPTDLHALGALLKAVAEPKRLLILHLLMEGVQCNCELGNALDLPPNLVSHHLRILREAGLVHVERDVIDSRWAYYSIDRARLETLRESFASFFDLGRIKQRRPSCGPRTASERVPAREAAGGAARN